MIQDILSKYDQLYTDLLYNEVEELINTLSDQEFTELCSENSALLAPISQEGGNKYLKQRNILLQIRHLIVNQLKISNQYKIEDLFKI